LDSQLAQLRCDIESGLTHQGLQSCRMVPGNDSFTSTPRCSTPEECQQGPAEHMPAPQLSRRSLGSVVDCFPSRRSSHGDPSSAIFDLRQLLETALPEAGALIRGKPQQFQSFIRTHRDTTHRRQSSEQLPTKWQQDNRHAMDVCMEEIACAGRITEKLCNDLALEVKALSSEVECLKSEVGALAVHQPSASSTQPSHSPPPAVLQPCTSCPPAVDQPSTNHPPNIHQPDTSPPPQVDHARPVGGEGENLCVWRHEVGEG